MTDSICKALLENTAEIVLSFNGKGEIRYGNKSALEKLNYTEESLKRQNLSKFFQQEFQQPGGKELAPFDVEKLRTVEETVMYREKTSCFPVGLRIFEDGPGEYFLLAEDITWQKDTERLIRQVREEEQANLRMRDEFTANVTHELRTPVNGIRGHVNGIIDGVQDEELRKTLNLVLFCCDNISAIINNILDFSKLEANKFILEEREFDFYKMLDQVIAIHMAEINKKELGMKVTVSEDIPQFVIGDSLRIGQILNNLLSNAVKFTKVGRIAVDVTKTYQSGDVVELFFMVRDSGIGISKEEQDKLFQSFVQVDASVTRNFGGTGLGLFITRQLVEMMGGTIRVDSEKGKGSCFSFSIKLRTSRTESVGDGDAGTVHQNFWNNPEESGSDPGESMYVFGSKENRREIKKRMEKLVLSMELGSWDKAEMLTDTVKALAGEADPALKRFFLRLEMSIRKENYESSMENYRKLKEALEEKLGE